MDKTQGCKVRYQFNDTLTPLREVDRLKGGLPIQLVDNGLKVSKNANLRYLQSVCPKKKSPKRYLFGKVFCALINMHPTTMGVYIVQ